MSSCIMHVTRRQIILAVRISNYPLPLWHHFTRLLGPFTLGPNGPSLQMQVESVRDGLFLGLQCIQLSLTALLT
jgi:hypothetical protein